MSVKLLIQQVLSAELKLPAHLNETLHESFSVIYFPWFLRTLATIFCSSIRKALTIFSLEGLTPLRARPVWGHLGTEGLFLRYWNVRRPPGVLTIFRLLERVLYDRRRRYVTR